MSDQPPTTPPVFAYLDANTPLLCHEHVALLDRGVFGMVRGADFLSQGLRLGEWCCYLAPAGRQGEMLNRLCELGRDAEGYLADQTLQFPGESLRLDALQDWAEGFFAHAERARAPGVRWLHDGTWLGPLNIPAEQFLEFHAHLNYLVKHYPSVALCQYYDVEHLELPHLFSAIAVHRHLLVEGSLVRDNPFYIPAEKFLSMNPEHRDHDLREVFQDVGSDVKTLLSALAGYGRLQKPAKPGP